MEEKMKRWLRELLIRNFGVQEFDFFFFGKQAFDISFDVGGNRV